MPTLEKWVGKRYLWYTELHWTEWQCYKILKVASGTLWVRKITELWDIVSASCTFLWPKAFFNTIYINGDVDHSQCLYTLTFLNGLCVHLKEYAGGLWTLGLLSDTKCRSNGMDKAMLCFGIMTRRTVVSISWWAILFTCRTLYFNMWIETRWYWCQKSISLWNSMNTMTVRK